MNPKDVLWPCQCMKKTMFDKICVLIRYTLATKQLKRFDRAPTRMSENK